PAYYQPSNITFGIMPPLERAPKGKKLRNEALSARALADLQTWMARIGSGGPGGPGRSEYGLVHGT
ncbi:MAG TPA: hypothetical protein VNG89_06220, partial [Vicinamibacterales bacterium]|nr:hypothetical protein [Vicinamibacterales bacterium]